MTTQCHGQDSLSIKFPGISEAILRQHVQALAHDSMQGRLTVSPSLDSAARYIASCVDSMSLQKINGNFLIPWKFKVNRVIDNHVVGVIPGNSDKDSILVFSAQYDHIGVYSSQKAYPFGQYSKRVKGDSTYNGANDNATGVAALQEIARVLSKSNHCAPSCL